MALIAWNYMGEKSLQFADIYDDIYETLWGICTNIN